MQKADELILYEQYVRLGKLAEIKSGNKCKGSLKNDNQHIRGISEKLPNILIMLENPSVATAPILHKKIISGKGMYIQFCNIRGRRPQCITQSLNENIDRLIRVLAKREAELLQKVRSQIVCGDAIDFESLFEEKTTLNKLATTLAGDLLTYEKTKGRSLAVSTKRIAYITKTGTKYHVEDCPFCRGRELLLVSSDTILERELTVCKCVQLKKREDKLMNFMTAFIDESIRPARWNDEGNVGKVGTFSYIICRGKLKDENAIHDSCVIDKGVDYMKEIKNIENFTEAAIGKVMMNLAYNHNFTGHLRIFTDNQSTTQKWNCIDTNLRLAGLFESVTVSYIPREHNTKADRLGRTRVYLSLPVDTYNEIVDKISAYDRSQLKTQVEKQSINQDSIVEQDSIKKTRRVEQIAKALYEKIAVIIRGFVCNRRNWGLIRNEHI